MHIDQSPENGGFYWVHVPKAEGKPVIAQRQNCLWLFAGLADPWDDQFVEVVSTRQSFTPLSRECIAHEQGFYWVKSAPAGSSPVIADWRFGHRLFPGKDPVENDDSIRVLSDRLVFETITT